MGQVDLRKVAPLPEVGRRPTRGCTRRGTELKILQDDPVVINVCPAGDPVCSTDLLKADGPS
jgi:hypothetical protein